MQQCLASLYYSQDEVIVQEIPGLTPEHPFNRGFLSSLLKSTRFSLLATEGSPFFCPYHFSGRYLSSISGLTQTIEERP
jgi:hypothetical protein